MSAAGRAAVQNIYTVRQLTALLGISNRQFLTRELTFDAKERTETMTDALSATKTRTSRWVLQVPDLVLECLREWMIYVAKFTKSGL